MRPTSPPGSTGPDAHDQPARTGILTATRGVHAPPELTPASGRAPRRYVVALLLTALLLAAVVGAANALVDPYGAVGTGVVGPAVWTDRTQKVLLAKRLSTPPRVVVLGSSRAMKVQPSYITRLTGLPAFNAAVSSGRPVDSYVFARFLHDRSPLAPTGYLWLLDQEAFADDAIDPTLLADQTLARYLPRRTLVRGRAADLSRLFSWETLRLSWRTLRNRHTSPPAGPTPQSPPSGEESGPQPVFAPDGYRVSDANTRAQAGGRPLSRGIAQSRQVYLTRYRESFPTLAASPREFFERSLAAMNSWGATPVIVLSPMHPRLQRDLRPYGWSTRHRELVAYLRSLGSRYRFALLDMSRIRSFGGSRRFFYDGVHMMPANYRRLVRAVLRDPRARMALTGGDHQASVL